MSSSESFESDEDLESEEEEPQLKYDRVANNLLQILSKDAASCVAMHFKFVALGTHWGVIYILDHNGNNISSKQFASHNTQVTAMSLDDEGEFLASCSDDGKVVVTGLYSDNDNMLINVDKPVKSIALDPNFAKSSTKQLVYGVDSLVLVEKGWLGRAKNTLLHTGEGLVRNIKWHGQLIAWANDWGVKMYDMRQRRRITHIPRSGTGHLRAELYPAHIAWKDENTLLVGWANEIKVCVVRERKSRDLAREPEKYVEIVYHLPVDFACCGIAPFGDQLVVLAFELPEEGDLEEGSGAVKSNSKHSERPQLRILEPDPLGGGYDEISSDALSIRGYQTYRCNDYSLTHESAEGLLYIVSPKDIVVARRRDQDDHVSWLLECGMYEEALDAVGQFGKQLKDHNFLDVGMTYISHLLESQEYEDAARACVRVLRKDVKLWDEMVYKFAAAGELSTLSPYLPQDQNDVRLPQRCYELVLADLLAKDHEGFAKLIKEWPSDLYNIAFVVNMVLSTLDDNPDNTTLLASLARLYALDQRYDRALSIYLKLRHPDTFSLIRKHNLYAALKRNIVHLMEFGGERAVSLLLDNMEHVPIEKVVKELEEYPVFLHMYLHSLFLQDPHLGSSYHSLQLRLYAEFDRPKLLPFLKSSNYYALEEALRISEEREYVDETVFLLARMGNASRALSLIIANDSDVFRAVKFCKEQNDMKLWEELIEMSVDKPEFIRDLLENIGTHVDPVILIQRIPTGLCIPGLRDALVKILQDYSMQTSMWFQCKRILSTDVIRLTKRQHKIHTRAFRVDDDRLCDACGEPLMISPGPGGECPIIEVFLCHHLFHDECLPQQNRTSCGICSGQRRRT